MPGSFSGDSLYHSSLKEEREVHAIFDNPRRLQNTPKFIERQRRDATAKVPKDHNCDELNSSTVLPHKKWREIFISCRTCKRNLVKFYFLHNAGSYVSKNQTLYVAGSFDGDITDIAWLVCGQQSPHPNPLVWQRKPTLEYGCM